MMKIISADDYKDMSRKAANIIAAEVTLKPDCVLGLATGSTPVGIYEYLAKWNKKGTFSFANVKTVNLDEYVGLDAEHKQSYARYMRENLFDNIDISKKCTNIPNGTANDLKKECRRYDNLIEEMGGIDLQLLGLGHDGHIGFNEPDDVFYGETHAVTLDSKTIEANSRLFKSVDEVPKKAITMGMKAIMNARRILMVVNGKDKAEILKKIVTGAITPKIPGSVLQLHPNVMIVADEEALSLFNK